MGGRERERERERERTDTEVKDMLIKLANFGLFSH